MLQKTLKGSTDIGAASVKMRSGLLYRPTGTTAVKYVVIIYTAEAMERNIFHSSHVCRLMKMIYWEYILVHVVPQALTLLRRWWWKRLLNEHLLKRLIQDLGPILFTNIHVARESRSTKNAYQLSSIKYTPVSVALVLFQHEQEYEMAETL